MLHDGLLRRGSAGPYFRANPVDAAEVRPPVPAPGEKAYPRRHAARMGATRVRWEPHGMQTTLIHIALAKANTRGRR
jgi:hypothetical protein